MNTLSGSTDLWKLLEEYEPLVVFNGYVTAFHILGGAYLTSIQIWGATYLKRALIRRRALNRAITVQEVCKKS